MYHASPYGVIRSVPSLAIGERIALWAPGRKILQSTLRVLNALPPTNHLPEKWDGHAGERIADILIAALSRIAQMPRLAKVNRR
jgi:hypothetical protein